MRRFLPIFLALAAATWPVISPAQEAADEANMEAASQESGFAGMPRGELEPQSVFSSEGAVLPLTLRRSIELALESNEDIMIGRLDFERAAADFSETLGIFDPVLSVSSSYRNSESPQANVFNPVDPVVEEKTFNLDFGLTGLLPPGTKYSLLLNNRRTESTSGFVTLSPEYRATASASLTQPLLRGFGLGVNLGQVTIARTQRRIAGQDFRRTVSDVVLETIEAYWELSFATENLRNQQDSLQVAKDLIRIAENRVRVKLDPPIALTQAREGAARREEQVIIAENLVGIAEDNLKRLIGLTRNNSQLNARIKLIEAPLERTEIPNADEAILLARRQRPEYEIARLTYENLDSATRLARNATLPKLDVGLEGGLVGVGGDVAPTSGSVGSIPLNTRFGGEFGTAYDQIFGADTPYWQVSATLSVSLGSHEPEARLRKALLDEQTALEQFKIVDKTVLLEVRTSIRNVITDLKRVRTTEVSVELAGENLDAERRRYEVGLSTSFDVLEQEEKLNLARTNYRRAVADYNGSLARYQKAAGTLLSGYDIILSEEPEPLPPPAWAE